jgi:hypothetical protein
MFVFFYNQKLKVDELRVFALKVKAWSIYPNIEALRQIN